MILPLFALANAGIVLHGSAFGEPVSMAVMVGLIVGKPLGIVLASWLAVKLVLKQLPEGLSWSSLLGAGCLAGIGFTMAIFIAELALEADQLYYAKCGILAASVVSAVLGVMILRGVLPAPAEEGAEDA